MIAGLDIGGTKCAVVLGKEREAECPELVYRKEIPTRGSSGDILAALTEELKKQCPLSEIEGVGISCGGPLDAERGIVLSPPNLPDWREVPLQSRDRKDGLLLSSNDADACALAEWKYGAGRERRT
ncbi:MAG: ROK family protein [Christensenellaceae bacterium]